MILSNYPIRLAEEAFGNMVRQCQEERRLELRMEMIETEMVDASNDITLDILKAELRLVDPASRHQYMK
jgi:hypothetical protein